MASRVILNALFSFSRQASTVAAAAQRPPVAAAPVKSAAKRAAASVKGKEDQAYWMRDPKTGDWVPENRVGDHVDAAELRAQLLGKK